MGQVFVTACQNARLGPTKRNSRRSWVNDVDNAPSIGLTQHTMRPFRALFPALLLIWPLLLVAGCEEQSKCESICVRVAECRREVPQEEQMLGIKSPTRDKTCKERCQNNPDGFGACEEKKRLCPDLLSCTGRF